MDGIKKEEKIEKALRKQKKEEVKRELLKDRYQTEDEIEKKIREEKWRTKELEKSIKHNAKVYKDDIKNQMLKLMEKKGDPDKIRITASASFKEKLIIE